MITGFDIVTLLLVVGWSFWWTIEPDQDLKEKIMKHGTLVKWTDDEQGRFDNSGQEFIISITLLVFFTILCFKHKAVLSSYIIS
jgi:hypothetical protein